MTIEKIFEYLDDRDSDIETLRKLRTFLESNTTINVCTKHAKRTDSYSYGQAPTKTNDNIAMSPLQYAMAKNKWLCAKFLLDRDVRSLSIFPDEFATPLHEIARCDNQDFLLWLWNESKIIEHLQSMSSVQINCRNEDRLTPFMLAIKMQTDLERITIWGNFPNDYDAKDKSDRNILHIAIEAKHTALIPKLVNTNNALVSMRTLTGTYPLHIAAMNNNLVAMEALWQAGASVNVFDKDFSSPLHRAAQWGNIEAMRFLLQRGANVNASNWDKDAAVHLVIRNHHSYVSNGEEKALQTALTLLLDYGADFHMKNKRANNAWEMAAECIESNEAKKQEFYWAVENYNQRTPTLEMMQSVTRYLKDQAGEKFDQDKNNAFCASLDELSMSQTPQSKNTYYWTQSHSKQDSANNSHKHN